MSHINTVFQELAFSKEDEAWKDLQKVMWLLFSSVFTSNK